MSEKPEDTDESGEEESEDSPSEGNTNRPPGFSFTKSAIADLPSCAVQSLHIENENPVEVDDEAFVWKDVSPSGTKLAGKAKFKKVDWMKNKVHPPSAAPPGKIKVAGSVAVGAKVASKPSTLKNNPKVAKGTTVGVAAGHSLVKAGSVPKVPSTGSKNRLKERRASGSLGQGKVAVTAPKKASSGTKVAALMDGSKVGGGSKTKLVKHREKHGNADHGKHQQHGRSKQ